MPGCALRSAYLNSTTVGRLLLTAALLIVWELPSRGATSSEEPAPTQTDSTLDLPLELPSPDGASAEQASSEIFLSESTLFDEIPTVYGAAKYDQKVHEAPAAVTIITADQIKKYGYRTFAQILDSVPGLFTTTDRNYGYLGIRGFNRPGDYNTRVLILIDNHRLNDAVYDQGAIGTEAPIDVDVIDRVEIIKGPASSLYGTNAFFGVINVITKRGRDLKGVEASGEASSFNTYLGRLSYGNKFSNGLEVLLSGSYSGSEGHRELVYPEFSSTNNGVAKDADKDNFYYYTGKLTYGDFTLTGGYKWRKKQVPTAAFGTVFNDNRFNTVDERTYVDFSYQHEFANQLNLKARLYYDRYYYRGQYPYDYASIGIPPFTLNQDVTQTDWWGAELTATKRLFDRHKITAGTEYRDQFRQYQANRDVEPPATYLEDRRDSSFIAGYLQDEWAITDHLTLNAGFRHDHYSTFGGTTNPRAGLISTWGKTTVKVLYGQAFRAPNAYEQFYVSSVDYKTNPNLQPEKITTYELILEQYLGNHIRLLGSLYQYNISRLITQTVDPADGLIVFKNLGDTTARGVELTMEGKWPTGLEGRVSYALQNSHIEPSEQNLTNSPQHLVKANLIVPIIEDKLFGAFEGRYTSSRLTLAGNNASPFYILNLSLFSQRIVKGWELSAHINNLTNQKYGYPGSAEHLQDVINQDGRTFWAKLKYRF
ncbi:MAG: TonB-dependent receptor [Nitrospira sp.]|nr:TonB-dependent receptor [Nitrospira sp.]MDH4245236.1 TonB-dependent receptor [Nitrospira sp.]MDH4357115.1 TonB-dependent receptor [Nitrospira sp.]MDH5318161.1 TonB-dependent receptor [Nitrospira sp.]